MLEMLKLLKIERRCPIFKQNSFLRRSAQCHTVVENWNIQNAYFRNEGHYRSEDLSRDKFLGVLSQGGNKKLAGLANFDFRIL